MTTADLPLSPAPELAAEQVFAYADQRIAEAADALWPDSRIDMGQHVPSPTAYVRRMRVDGQAVFAKYSFLGMSLVSLLRGAAGDWSRVRAEQEFYVQRPDSLIRRETEQLAFLSRLHGPVTGVLAGQHNSVLFTAPAGGTSLGQMMLAHPARTAGLLDRTVRELRPLHAADPRSAGAASSGTDRGITETFQRKFHQPGSHAYIDSLTTGHASPAVIDSLHRIVTRLSQFAGPPSPKAALALCYGDLKPEHIIFPRRGRPVFIDPGLLVAHPRTDLAKLISRTVLLLAANRPPGAGQVIDGLAAHVGEHLRGSVRFLRPIVLRELLTWWVMDTTSILTTYLAAPSGLPLPHTGHAVIARATSVVALADTLTDQLYRQLPAQLVWTSALQAAKEASA
ncbi:phosphotransferase [Streptomyces sp. NPDC051555]|uniref:phosphotransferase n=1 Tax=Streptomyces sp. NPDC051555 TaxID=3365657 RepID=UPI00378ECD91